MTLAPPGVRHDPDAEPADLSPKPAFHNALLSEKGEIKSVSVRKGNITLEGVKDSSKGSGPTPTGFARVTPRKLDQQEEPLLERKRSNRDSVATVEGINKGYPNHCE